VQRQHSASALALIPHTHDLNVLKQAATTCNACPLHCNSTQTVFGEGPVTARVALVGEQPGDVEDECGRPFVGPAGEVLDRALAEAGVPRADVYLTNAVKHFKFAREAKRRIHQTPRMSEIIACKPWLEAELEAIRPSAIVLLGSTAAKSLLGATVKAPSRRARFCARATPSTPSSACTRVLCCALSTPRNHAPLTKDWLRISLTCGGSSAPNGQLQRSEQ
jgi:uracil-DNA glycosylase family protein